MASWYGAVVESHGAASTSLTRSSEASCAVSGSLSSVSNVQITLIPTAFPVDIH